MAKSKSPTPGGFQTQIPTPMWDGGGDPMGPVGYGGGAQTLLRVDLFHTELIIKFCLSVMFSLLSPLSVVYCIELF